GCAVGGDPDGAPGGPGRGPARAGAGRAGGSRGGARRRGGGGTRRGGRVTEPIDVLEALLFASDAPVEPALIQEVLDLPSAEAARALVESLRERFDEQARVLQVIEVGGGFRLVTRPEIAPWLVKLARSRTRSRLSRP